MFPDKEKRMRRLLGAKTCVFWDVDDYPVTDIVSFGNNIKLALKNVGYTSDDVSITAYGANESASLLYNKAGFTFVFKVSKLARLFKIITDMFHWDALARRSGGSTNMLLISKALLFSEDKDDDQEEESGYFHYVRMYVSRLHHEGPNMLYVVPDDFQPENFPHLPLHPECPVLNCIWSWGGLLRGGKPLVIKPRNQSMIT